MSALTDEQELAAIRAHEKSNSSNDCLRCGWVWPCDTARALVALDAERAVSAALAAATRQRDEAQEARVARRDGFTSRGPE